MLLVYVYDVLFPICLLILIVLKIGTKFTVCIIFPSLSLVMKSHRNCFSYPVRLNKIVF